ncbi:MAG: DNA mismatch repair protein MutS [Bacteroidales bacterium]|nr:DNA mismatch repair protein MutS [Bacteroidales bacterium]MDD4672368.1 DNA mismatch repair protein MutS [Bacteroidales bacterium]MDY0347441.1 DNA mismatch repair protein MutS [Tenuifilaceae bacterium]
MQLKKALTEISGLRYMVDRLDLKSGLGHRMLLASPFLVNPEDVQYHLQQVNQTVNALKVEQSRAILDKVTIKISHVRDIIGTIKNIQNQLTLNDIELFEVKSFALIANDIRTLVKPIQFIWEQLPNLEEVIEILDPEGARIPSFYINNSFAPELGPLRKKQIGLEFLLEDSEGDTNNEESALLQQQSDELRNKITEIEDRVRQDLSDKLFNFAPALHKALTVVGNIDILITKAKQAISEKLVMPKVKGDITSYQGLFYPQLKATLEQDKKRYQPIDIDIYKGTCLITGANMAGKTVLLKTLALSQALCQYGFFVPATSAKIVLVEQILFSIADEQSELSGLSSYASEMLKVNNIVQLGKKQKRLLVLIDELARTTNPTEGRAIVSAVANIMDGCNVRAVITTHYSGLTTQCRKLRVKGFMEKSKDASITVENIGEYIDYSLVEDDGSTVPHEALRIAQILGIDADILSEASKELDIGKDIN